MNYGKKIVYHAGLEVVYKGNEGFFFVHGHGGSEKTFLYNAIISSLRSEGKIVLAVASSGIESLLLPGGRTVHSRFKIPIDVHSESSCHINKGSQLAKLIKKACVIVWDKAPMTHRHCFEALDRSMRDILTTDEEPIEEKNFGGKIVLLGGDFRQILPVIVKGSRYDTVKSCITQSHLWPHCNVYVLKDNMLLSDSGLNPEQRSELKKFSDWLLDIGEGRAEAIKMDDNEDIANWIKIPQTLLLKSEKGEIEDMITKIYDDLQSLYTDSTLSTKWVAHRMAMTYYTHHNF
ncbi:uncharacterized protein LOC119980265 [Tripterygium wilfordii]|uniref:uncharacterized protein LOC119980265 n=1 Tax=Tripterygium wilfordii TaxID=458696 RepID=UPI0018F82D96|nr:uncharacterized protein LOC119980265 [Tripterygium wilfordii]